MDQCLSCRFYHQRSVTTRQTTGGGECRRHPAITPAHTHHREYPDLGIFPAVMENDWCGDFQSHAATRPTCCVDQANAAFNSASQQDAPDAAVAAHCGECDGDPNSRPPARRRYSPAI